MHQHFFSAAGMILCLLAVAAAAPGKAPATKPEKEKKPAATQPSIRESLMKGGLKIKMSEAEVQAALDRDGVKVVKKEQSTSSDLIFWFLDDGRHLGFRDGKLAQAGRPTPPRNAATKPAKS